MVNRYNFSNFEAPFKHFLLAVNDTSPLGIITKPLHKLSIKNYLSDIRHFFGWYLLYRKLSDPYDPFEELKLITIEAISSYIDYLVESAIPKRTINRRLSSLRKFCSFCVSKGWLTDNPAKKINNLTGFNQSLQKDKPKTISLSAPFMKKFQQIEDEKEEIYYLIRTYKKYFLAVLVALSIAIFILTLYSLKKVSLPVALLKSTTEPTRTLSFQGKLADQYGNILTSFTKAQFRIYKNSRSDEYIYSSGICTINPDEKGEFTITVGKDCGPRIANSVFIENQHLYLGIKVGSDPEMTPRREITNTGFAENANTLQGLPVGTKPGSIPYIDQTGTLLIGTASPSLRSESGNFSIQGQSLTLETAQDSAGNISLAPGQGGNVFITSGDFSVGQDFRVAHTGGLMKINQLNYFWPSVQGISDSVLTDDGLGNLSWSPVTPTGWHDDGTSIRLTSALDNVSIGTATSSAKLTISSTNSQRQLLVRGSSVQSSPIIEVQNSSGGTLLTMGPTGAITTNADFFVNAGNISSNAQTFNLFGSEVTTLNIGGAATSLNLGSGSGTTSIKNSLAVNNGLEVTGSQTKIQISTQYTERLCHSGADSSTTQHVLIGDCSSGGADLAEYYGSSDQSIEAGDIVVAADGAQMTEKGSKAYVKKSTKSSQAALIGIVSTNPYDSFGKNFGQGDFSFPVALSGRVPVKISPESQPIHAGDFITSSSVPGRGMKAQQAGVVIGKALESWNGPSQDKILILVNLSWADPNIYITDNGALQIPPDDSDHNQQTYRGLLTKAPKGIADIIAEKLTSSLVQAQNIIAHSLSTDVLVSNKVTSHVVETTTLVASESAKIPTVQTSNIEPQNDNITVDL